MGVSLSVPSSPWGMAILDPSLCHILQPPASGTWVWSDGFKARGKAWEWQGEEREGRSQIHLWQEVQAGGGKEGEENIKPQTCNRLPQGMGSCFQVSV